MKKRILACVVACVTTLSVAGVGCTDREEVNELTWSNYVETTEAYVSDTYYYTVPDVQDEKGTVYEVFVDVADAAGKEVDSFGGFFLVEKAEKYKITYSVDDGRDIHSKTTTVVGIEKATYELADIRLIYGLNEVVDLDGKVRSSTEGEIVYSVQKGDENIAVTDNAFTATEAGVYTVQAKIDRHPAYSFEIYAVDKSKTLYADAMVLDGADKTDIRVGATFDDLKAEVSFDETKKYDGASNGSYKIQATTTGTVEVDGQRKQGVAATRTLSFDLKPAYGSGYYKTLQAHGYKYIAVRYMIEASEYDGTTRFDYISASGEDEMAIYYDGGRAVDKSSANGQASYTYWNYQLDKVPTGAWAEMLLDINKFTTYYDDREISLFQLVVNKNSSWDLTMYIDNIYAVKDEAVSTAGAKIVEKGSEVDLSALFGDTGINDAIRTITCDGELISVADDKLKIESYSHYAVDVTDRTAYGRLRQDIVTKGAVVSFAPTAFSATHGNANGAVTNFSVTKNEATNAIAVSSNGAGKVNADWQRTTYTVKPLGGVSYYEQLKDDGYNYVTYEYTLDYGAYTMVGGTDMYRAALTKNKIPHYNANGLNADAAATHRWLCTDDNSNGDTSAKASNKYFQSTSYPDTLWNGKTFIVSVSIDDFIKFYNGDGMNILTLYFSKAQPDMGYSVTFGRIFPTKEACVFDE